jgi:hypothetical protein
MRAREVKVPRPRPITIGLSENIMVMTSKSPILQARSEIDPVRLKKLQHALREAMKPSRWYYDDPTNTASLYRKRYEAVIDISVDILKHSQDAELIAFVTKLLDRAHVQLPRTYAFWVSEARVVEPQSDHERSI